MRIVVASVKEFDHVDRKIIDLGRRSIGVFRVGDSFYALNNRCPHQGGPLCLGNIAPWAVSNGPGDFGMDERTPLLACPWHGWEYDLATGQSFMGPGEAPVRDYEVTVQPGGALSENGERVGGRVPGPYVAETFAVEVEQEYVVVDTQRRPAGDNGAAS